MLDRRAADRYVFPVPQLLGLIGSAIFEHPMWMWKVSRMQRTDVRSWLDHDGEMSERISAHDWAATGLGDIETWPQSLRLLTGMLLRFPLPTILLWGPHGIILYNDAFMPLAGDSHPSILGKKMQEIAAGYEGLYIPMLSAMCGGKLLSLRDQVFVRYENGLPQETKADIDCMPMPDDSGKFYGAFIRFAIPTGARSWENAALEAASILESVSDPIFVVDDKLRIVYANEDTKRLVKCDGHDLSGRLLSEVFPALIEGENARWIERSLQERRAVEWEICSTVAGVWLHARAYPTRDGGVAFFFQNIEERKRSDLQLRERETFISAINNSVMALIAVLDLRTKKVVYANPFSMELLGYSPEELFAQSGEEIFGMIHPDDIPRMETVLRQARHASPQERISIDFRYRHKNGEYIWTHADGTPFGPRDEKGCATQILYVMEDITERRRAEERLLDSEKRMRLATEAAVAYTWEVDLVTMKFHRSSNVEAVLGFPLPEDTENSQALLHPDDRFVMDAFQRAASGSGKYDVQCRMINPRNGETVWIHSQGHVIRDNENRTVRFIGITQNINERKRAEMHAAFLAEIHADFSLLADSEEIMRVAGGKIGRYFEAPHVCFFEIDDTHDEAKLLYGEHKEPRLESAHVYRLTDFLDARALSELKAGRPVTTPDAGNRLHVYAPHFSDGHWRFLLAIEGRENRAWKHDEVSLIRELSSGIWLRLERAYAEEALRTSEERYRALFESIDEGFCVVEMQFDSEARRWDCRFLEVNPAFEIHSGLKNVVGKTMRELLPEVEDLWLDTFARVALSGEPVRFDSRSDALNRWFSISAFRIGKSNDGRLALVFNDITDRKHAQDELFVSNERFKLAVEGSGDGVWDWDVVNDSTTFSKRWKEILGYNDQELSGTNQGWRRANVHPEDLSRVMKELNACLNGFTPSYVCEYRLRCKDGSWKWILARGVVVVRDAQERPMRMTGTMTDISERKRVDERVWQHANFDALTGLPNRRLFRDRLDHEVRKAQRTKRQFGLLFIDLDRFKQVNDLLGHDAGDLLLTQAAQRLRRCIRESDTVARLGGDEFTVILTELETLGQVEQVCQKILHALSQPFPLGAEIAYLSGSIGITLYPSDAVTSEELIRKADQAMYAAKNAGKNQFSYFTQSMDERAHLRLKLSGELRNALQDGQLEVYYQPVIDLSAGGVVKAEALLRWHHPAMGLVEPAEFIPLAEESGIINEIGDWVFREAALCSRRWGIKLGFPFQIGVNKSPIQFLPHAEQESWLEHMEQLGLPKKSISVEITEGLLLHASSSVTNKLLEYRDAGIQVAIDDFGTGYSSMAYLKKFDIDYLKIDQSFVRDMATDTGSRTIAESIIVMAHKLGLKVIAEGIENVDQKRLLIDAGCDYGQGFLFSHPLPASEFEAMLDAGPPVGIEHDSRPSPPPH